MSEVRWCARRDDDHQHRRTRVSSGVRAGVVRTNSLRHRIPKESRRFESTPLHHPVPRFSEISENRSKSARVRAICDRAWTQRASLSGRSARVGQFLSPRDLPRSADHRHAFAYDSAARDLQIIAHHHPSLSSEVCPKMRSMDGEYLRPRLSKRSLRQPK